jgi:hypothetical protein
MPTGGSTFLQSLTKRKKSPETLVKLAVACLQELPASEDESWTCPTAEGLKPPTLALGGLSLDEASKAKQQPKHAGSDDLGVSGQSISSSAASTGSDTAVSRRPSFFLSAFGKKESSSSADPGSAPHPQSSLGSSGESGAADASGKSGRPGSRPPSLSVSKFFSDSSRKSAPLSPHGSGLSHSTSLGQTATEDGTVMERLAKRLSQMKLVLYGDGEKEVDKDKCVDLAENIIKEGLMPLLLDRFTNLPFEARKDAAQIFNNIARHNHGGFADPYIADQHFSIMEQLINVRTHLHSWGWGGENKIYIDAMLTSLLTHRAMGTPRWR